jgi:branched-chain amino acid transport system substrate-binding protein
MRRRNSALIAVVVATAAVLSACGTSSNGASAGGGQSAKPGSPIKLGFITAKTGVASSTFANAESGFKARIELENAHGGVNGHKLDYVAADDTSTGPGAAAAVQKLIQQDKVFAIGEVTPYFAGGIQNATKAGVPVAGVSFDGGKYWQDGTAPNAFAADGYGTHTVASTTLGKFLKAKGVTNVYAVGYGDIPSSVASSTSVVTGAKSLGLKGTTDTSLPVGSTDVGPLVQKIKSSGADGVVLYTVASTNAALATGLKEAGVHPKAILALTGYGQPTIDDKATASSATGMYFTTQPSPIEMGTAATKALSDAMAKYAHFTGIPDFAQYYGWEVADLLIHGLKLAGSDASQKAFISKLRSSTWDSGLTAPTNFADIKKVAGGMDQRNCVNIVRFDGTKFTLEPDASPVCGENVN